MIDITEDFSFVEWIFPDFTSLSFKIRFLLNDWSRSNLNVKKVIFFKCYKTFIDSKCNERIELSWTVSGY